MAASLDKTTIARLLLTKTDAEISLIAAQAATVALGMSSSVSALTNSTTFNRDDANVILAAVDMVRGIRTADPGANANSIPEPSLGHRLRFQPVRNPVGVTWGP